MIEVLDLIKKFDDYVALNGVNINIKNGCIYGLVGTNGSGKSTLLRSICGIYSPTWGEIKVDNQSVFENTNVKSSVFFVSDDMFFPQNATVKSTAEFYKSIYPKWNEEKFNHLLSVFPIDANKKIKNFSKGMYRQAALIIALSCETNYILLDEAFDGLDPVIRVAIRKIIADEVSARNMTVIISSHNLRELEDFCDTVGILHKGKVVTEQCVDDININFSKIQAAFKTMPSKEAFEDDDILSVQIMGSVVTVAAKCSQEKLEDKINTLSPIFAESMPLSLEEVFIYEMEAYGYDCNSILLG